MSASTTSSILNLTKTIIGSGMLAIPFAYKQDGIFTGVLLTIISFLMTCIGLYFFVYVADFISFVKKNPKEQVTFETMCKLVYGDKDYKKNSVIFNAPMFLQCFGVCLSYLVLIGGIFHTLVPKYEASTYILLTTIVIVPLCLLPKLDNLKYSSMMGLGFICYIALFIISEVFIDSSLPIWNKDTVAYGINWLSISSTKECLSSFSILIFAFTASMNILPIFNESSDRSLKNIRKIILTSVGFSCGLFIVLGLVGYLSFGKYADIQGNVLLNYEKKFVTNSCLSFVVLVSFPLMFYPLRICTNSLIDSFEIYFSSISPEETQPLVSENEAETTMSEKRFNWITFVNLTFIYLLSLLVKDFALVLALVGGVAATAISFILPGFILLKVLTLEEYQIEIQQYTKKKGLLITLSKVLMCFGFLIMILSVYSTLTK
uniref:Vacuolar amino acid transporter 7 n=1 Tax=Hanseniaspora opuntiae TaxID=211096 RepID=A0A1E5RL34_9ASCO